jgi:hypothetical protein
MKIKLIVLLLCSAAYSVSAQEPEPKSIRVVDTLTPQEIDNRNTVILKSELDSLVRLHIDATANTRPIEPVVPDKSIDSIYLAVGAALLLVIACLLYLLFNNQKKFHRVVRMLHKQVQHLEMAAYASGTINDAGAGGKSKAKSTIPLLERKVESLNQQLEKAKVEKEELVQQLSESTKVHHDFESVKQQMMEVYKIRNYPGFNKEKTETEIVKSMLETERSVALYAYEHFLKPVMAITDANKNDPARIRTEEREKLVDLLISLSLLYSEYLYLRIGELSVGGKIVERIASLKNGSSIDPATLKVLSTEHGSRALVVRMALDKTSIQHLSYPVFDETNLNLS